MSLAAQEGTALALEVRWRWGDQLLAVEHLSQGSLRLDGERELAHIGPEGCLVRVPRGARALVDDGTGPVPVGGDRAGAELELAHHERALVQVGPLSAELAFAARPSRVRGALREALDLTFVNLLVLVAFLLGLGALGALSSAPDPDAEPEVALLRHAAELRRVQVVPPKPPPPSSAAQAAQAAPVAEVTKPAQAPKRPAPTPRKPAGAPGRGEGRKLAEQLFAGVGQQGLFGGPGLGSALSGALEGVGAPQVGGAGLSGLNLRGGPPGGSGPLNTIQVGGSPRPGRHYGEGVGELCPGGLCKGKTDPILEPTPEIVITNSMDRELVRQVVHRNRQQLRFCYEESLIGTPALSGRVEVHFVIGGEGRVLQANVAHSTAGNSQLEHCLTERFKSWEFPKPKGGGLVEVTYPVVLAKVK